MDQNTEKYLILSIQKTINWPKNLIFLFFAHCKSEWEIREMCYWLNSRNCQKYFYQRWAWVCHLISWLWFELWSRYILKPKRILFVCTLTLVHNNFDWNWTLKSRWVVEFPFVCSLGDGSFWYKEISLKNSQRQLRKL